MNLQFKALTAEDIPGLTKYYERRHDLTCDSVILDNYLWGEYYDIRYCARNDEALLWLMNIHGKYYAALPVCEKGLIPKYLKELEQYFNEELHLPLEVYLADEDAVGFLNLPADRYSVTELPDNQDYLYEAEALKTLSGKKLHKKKNHLNGFLRQYEGRFEYRTLVCEDKLNIWGFLDKWREQKGQEVEGHLDYEVRGIHKVLTNCGLLDVRMGGVFIDGALEAFSIGSYNKRERMAIIHIEKANPEIVGLYQYINQQFLIHGFPEAEIVNREDDMGIPGLRQAKLSYAPFGFAKKYRIRQLNADTETK